ncbi:MAG: imidazolonepropionase [Candidatus Eremiobacteraeota bacterium]|nr:imidazolonepropionase [Candidatus Eremiobacteraeota bacterium]
MVSPPHARSYALRNATLVTLAPLASVAGAQARIAPDDLGVVAGGTLLVEHGVITAVGTHADCRAAVDHARSRYGAFEEHDVRGQVVMPGFVDAHTHALFAGNRVADFEDLAAGRTPALGMRYTIAQTRAASQTALLEIGERHLTLMLQHGTTTAEVKSGYALTGPGELALLAVIAELGKRAEMPRLAPTFCGAHALPPEFSGTDAFVTALCDRMLPDVAAQRIAWFGDAFCERGFFTPEQSERFLRACARAGLRVRIHADELSRSGGALVAGRLRAASADHCNFIDDADIAALAGGGCVAVLCPGTVEYLGLTRYAPARELMDAGVPIALATDYNPGTCPCFSLQTIAYLGRRHMRLGVHEVIAAMTINAAYSLGLGGEIGSLTAGKRADVVVLQSGDFRELGYSFGTNLVARATVGAKTA